MTRSKKITLRKSEKIKKEDGGQKCPPFSSEKQNAHLKLYKKGFKKMVLHGFGNFNDTTSMSINTQNRGFPDLSREIHCDSSYTQKFFEIIRFNVPRGALGKAIVIGANPALLDITHLDTTNAFMAERLWTMGYNGYDLLNMFNLVTPSVKQLFSYHGTSTLSTIDQREKVVKYLNQYHSRADLFLIWGQSNSNQNNWFIKDSNIKENLEFILESWGQNVYFNCYNGRFVHPMTKDSNGNWQKNIMLYDHQRHWTMIQNS